VNRNERELEARPSAASATPEGCKRMKHSNTRLGLVLVALASAHCTGDVRPGSRTSGSENTEVGQNSDSSPAITPGAQGFLGGDGSTTSVGATDGGVDPITGLPPDNGAVSPPGNGGVSNPVSSPVLPSTPGTAAPPPAVSVGFNDVPTLENLSALTIGDSVALQFGRYQGAADYRVYELPSADAVSVNDGRVTVRDATYRCAGGRLAPTVTQDARDTISYRVWTRVDSDVGGYRRTTAQATLGYVYTTPAADREPVYALGDTDTDGDNTCFGVRFGASMVKSYVTGAANRDALLRAGARDDGIAFYVPTAAASTRPVYTAADAAGQLYYIDGPEASKRSGGKVAFRALSSQAPGSVPLMRVYYGIACGRGHDELAAGNAQFDLLRTQGEGHPVARLRWAGLTKKTTLVVEALDALCPLQGTLAAEDLAPSTADNVEYDAWSTMSTLRKGSAASELFVNGQGVGTNPRTIARSFISVEPGEAPLLDWGLGFKSTDDVGKLSQTACGLSNCWGMSRFASSAFDLTFYTTQSSRISFGSMLGEWWVTYADIAADTNGRMRLTPKTRGTVAADKYLYATMEVDSFSTERRYPQLLISDREAPIQDALPQGNTVIIQPFAVFPSRIEVQVCDHRTWDVNNQCPRYNLTQRLGNNGTIENWLPNAVPGEQFGLDFGNRYEVYLSTKRAYVFFDGQPYGCANLPASGVPSGSVSVTFGDVLYHSGVDAVTPWMQDHRLVFTQRHFDNMGFKSGVAAPAWDEQRFPCTSTILD
jgi:hypothetical protein